MHLMPYAKLPAPRPLELSAVSKNNAWNGSRCRYNNTTQHNTTFPYLIVSNISYRCPTDADVVLCPLSTVHRPVSNVHCPLSMLRCRRCQCWLSVLSGGLTGLQALAKLSIIFCFCEIQCRMHRIQDDLFDSCRFVLQNLCQIHLRHAPLITATKCWRRRVPSTVVNSTTGHNDPQISQIITAK